MDSAATPFRLPAGRRRWRSLLEVSVGLGAIAIMALMPGLFVIGPRCGFYLATGASCPGCGMTRSGIALVHADLAASLAHHPLGLPLALLLLLLVTLAVYEGATGRPVFRNAVSRYGTRVAAGFLILLAVVWTVRVVAVPRWAPDPIIPGSAAAWLLSR